MSRLKLTDFGVAVIDGDTHLSKWIEERGQLAIDDNCNAAAERFLKPGDLAVDAGASIGDSTRAFLNKVGPSGRVLAFEPNPEAFSALAHNCPDAILLNMAIGSRDGFLRMNVETENIGMTWMNPKETGPVLTVRLDSLGLSRLRLLKLDIEGMELEAIAGAKETIAGCQPIVMAELNDLTLSRLGLVKQDVISKMESMNYTMELCQQEFGLDNVQVDVLFLPR